MPDLPRKAAARTARLAALPLGYAGRTALGFGKRLGGAPGRDGADRDPAAHRRAAVPDPGRAQGRGDEVRPGAERARGGAAGGGGRPRTASSSPGSRTPRRRCRPRPCATSSPPAWAPDWKEQLVWLDGGPTAAASIGQVHKGRWHDGRDVAVKVQYPGAGEALMSDLRQLARLGRTVAPLVPGVDIKPLVEEMQARAVDELDYELEAEAQRAFAEAFRDDPEIVVPDVVASGRRGAGHRVAGEPGLAGLDHPRGHPGGARPLRRAVRAVPVRRPGAHRHAARRPAPRELPDHPERRRAARAGSGSSTSARSPGWSRAACPRRWAR